MCSITLEISVKPAPPTTFTHVGGERKKLVLFPFVTFLNMVLISRFGEGRQRNFTIFFLQTCSSALPHVP